MNIQVVVDKSFTIKQIDGTVWLVDKQGNLVQLKPLDSVEAGNKLLMTAESVVETNEGEVITIANASTEPLDDELQQQIDAIEQALLSSDDPLQEIEAPAAGGQGAANTGSHSATTVNRDGTSTLADSGFETASDANSTDNIANDASSASVITGDDNGAVIEDTNVSQDAISASGVLTATDNDGQTAFNPTVIQGNFGTFTINAQGEWIYSAVNSQEIIQQLADAEQRSESFTVSTIDGSEQTIAINIAGLDDLAEISGTTIGLTVEDSDDEQTAQGELQAIDIDGEDGFQTSNETGQFGNFTLEESGAWQYTINNEDIAIQSLGQGETVQETFTVTTKDNQTVDITVDVQGTNDIPIVGDVSLGTILEDAPTGITFSEAQLLSLASDVDVNDTISVVSTSLQDSEQGELTDNGNGTWTFIPAEDFNGTVVFDVVSTDGIANVDSIATLSVTPVDDAAVISGDDVGDVTEDVKLTETGTLEAIDVDNEDGFNPETLAATYGELAIDANGNWTYQLDNDLPVVQALNVGDTLTDVITVTTVGGDTQTVTITIFGTDDLPVISGDDSGTVIEDTVLTTSGTLDITDIDNDTGFVAETIALNYGILEIDSSGNWQYQLTANNSDAVQSLNEGQSLSDPATVTTINGEIVPINITILGINEPVIIDNLPVAVQDAFDTNENSAITGTLATNDTLGDGTNVFTKTTDPINGTVTVNPDGTFTYTPNDDYTGQDNFTYTLTDADGDTSTASVVINVGESPAELTATIALDNNITADDVISSEEVGQDITVSGSVGGDVKENDTVTLTVNGKTFSGNVDGNGRFSIEVPGTDLLADSDKTIDASVTTSDGSGNSATATDTEGYSIDGELSATITLDNNITPDDVISSEEVGQNIAISGSVGGDVKENDTVTLTVNGKTFTGNVDGSGRFSIEVPGTDLLADSDKTIEASVTTSDNLGNTASATDTEGYTIDGELSATITLDADITPDDSIDSNEATQDIAVTGSVGGDVKENDTVTLTVNGDTFTGLVDGNGRFSIDVPGSDLLADSDKVIEASVTTSDNLGNTATGTDTEGYSIDKEPIAVNDIFDINEDSPITSTLASNDTLGDGSNTFAKATDPTNGTVTVNSDGTFTYTPNENYSGQDSFTYTLTDADGDESTATVVVNVAPVADTPDLNVDIVKSANQPTASVAASGKLENWQAPIETDIKVYGFSESNNHQSASNVLKLNFSNGYGTVTGNDSVVGSYAGSTSSQGIGVTDSHSINTNPIQIEGEKGTSEALVVDLGISANNANVTVSRLYFNDENSGFNEIGVYELYNSAGQKVGGGEFQKTTAGHVLSFSISGTPDFQFIAFTATTHDNDAHPGSDYLLTSITASGSQLYTDYDLNISGTSPDSNEVLSYSIQALPDGVVLKNATGDLTIDPVTNTYNLTNADLVGLTLEVPKSINANFNVSVTLTSTDGTSTESVTEVDVVPIVGSAPRPLSEDKDESLFSLDEADNLESILLDTSSLANKSTFSEPEVAIDLGDLKHEFMEGDLWNPVSISSTDDGKLVVNMQSDAELGEPTNKSVALNDVSQQDLAMEHSSDVEALNIWLKSAHVNPDV